MAKDSDESESDLSSVENYDELDEDQQMEDIGDEEDEELGDEEDEEEEEEEVEEGSEQEEPVSSDEGDDANFPSDDDFEEEEKPKKQKFRLNLRLSKPKDEDSVYTDEESIKNKPVRAKRKAAEQPPKVKKPVGRPRRTTQAAVNYKDYKYLDDKEFLSDDDVIPTPALDAEGLTDDEEEVQQDPTKMTERQRARLLDNDSNTSKYLSLGNRTYNKPKRVLTEEENQLRKAEIARKRKNMTEKKLEEEKQETINKLLKRRAAKTSSKTKEEDTHNEDGVREKPRRPQFTHPALFSWKSTKDAITLQVPEPLARKINIK